ncbi:hypothetical protein NE237_022590 [Protea cynaroides]|uniref:RNase H type-1 domain-containing protein n=1 Tax=Protea cynaroides TaxID=273540 RepID=A0A9Q0HCB8_9MAGN|nr:hypothetical protein NE237_022590 [Protea cynaroides]
MCSTVGELFGPYGPYFQAHSIIVLTDQPLKKILTKPDISGRVINWAFKLREFDLSYKPRTAIIAQAFVDFLIESSPQEEQGTDNQATEESSRPWTLFIDGASSKTQCGAGFILTSPKGFETRCPLRFMFQVSNNAAEYEALIAGLRLAKAVMARRVEASSNSQLVVRQVNGEYKAKKVSMSTYLKKVQEATSTFEYFTLRHILRD